MLLEGKHHAVAAVNAAVNRGRIVRHEHIRNVPKVNGLHPFHACVEQQQVFQFLQGGDLVAYAHKPTYAVLLHIARRHGKVLCLKDVRHHIHGNDVLQVRLLYGLCTRVFQLCYAIFYLFKRACELLFAALDL